MEYAINSNITTKDGFTIYELPEPLEHFKKFTEYRDDITATYNHPQIEREFAWSEDNELWSPYYRLTNDNLLSVQEKDKLYIKFKFTKLDNSDGQINVNSINIGFEQNEIEECPPEDVSSYMGLEFKHCPDFDPYEIGKQASKLEKSLNRYINEHYGWEILYFRTEPEQDTTDVILHEYSLHNVVNPDGDCIKVVLENNEVPEPKAEYTEWGTEWEKFEVMIDKTYFESKFGKDVKPRDEDYIYIKEMNRLYYVYSNYLARGTNEESTYYVLSLKKADDNISVNKTGTAKELIEEHTLNQEDLFGEQTKEEMEDITNPQQYGYQAIGDDPIREIVDSDMVITDKCISNNGTVIARGWYDMSTTEQDSIGIIYKTQPEIIPGDELGQTYWLYPNSTDKVYNQFSILMPEQINNYKARINVDKPLKTTEIYEGGFITNNSHSFEVVEVVSDTEIIINCRDISLLTGDFRMAHKINTICLHNTNGVDLMLLNYQHLVFKFNKDYYFFNLGTYDIKDKWVGFVVNLSTKFNYLEIYLYEINPKTGYPDKYSTSLTQKKKFSSDIDVSGFKGFNNPAFLAASNHKITNIRLWKKAVPIENHQMALNTYDVGKSSTAFVIDNAQPHYNRFDLGEGQSGYK